MICLACQATNEAGAATCFRCGKPLPMGLLPGRIVASRYEVLSTLGSFDPRVARAFVVGQRERLARLTK